MKKRTHLSEMGEEDRFSSYEPQIDLTEEAEEAQSEPTLIHITELPPPSEQVTDKDSDG
jgi:hypothetical protein